MIARRLLMGGGGAMVVPAPFSVVTAPNAGGWTEANGVHAFYDAGRTYIVWVGGNNKVNDIEIAAYVHATGVVEGAVLLKDNLSDGSSTLPDSHNGPAGLLRNDGYGVIAYCGHNSDVMRAKISNAALGSGWVASGFTTEINVLSTGSRVMTYPMLAQLGSTIWLFCRDRSGAGARTLRFSSTDGGSTWSAPTSMYEVTADFIYSAFAWNASRIDFAVTDAEPEQVGGYSLGHFYMEADGDCFKSDGTPITLPLTPSNITPIVAQSGGDSYPYSLAYDGANPVIAWQTKNAATVSFGEERWNGSAWIRTVIGTSDPISPSILSTGGGHHVWGDTTRFIQSVMSGGALRVHEYRNSGSWGFVRDLGSGHSPVLVRNGSGLVSLWFSPASSFTDSDTFEPGLAGIA